MHKIQKNRITEKARNKKERELQIKKENHKTSLGELYVGLKWNSVISGIPKSIGI